MHALHRILVYLPDIGLGGDATIDDVRRHAVDETEQFYNHVFDWRETDSAGRWSGGYPENVIFGRDSTLKIIKELVDLSEVIGNEIKRCVKCLYKETSTYDISKIVSSKTSGMGKYYLQKIGSLYYGEYTFDSMFYNTRDCDSLITDALIDEIKENPRDWAVVLFDYHY